MTKIEILKSLPPKQSVLLLALHKLSHTHRFTLAEITSKHLPHLNLRKQQHTPFPPCA